MISNATNASFVRRPLSPRPYKTTVAISTCYVEHVLLGNSVGRNNLASDGQIRNKSDVHSGLPFA